MLLDRPRVKQAIAGGETRLAESGRLVIRKSGTEPFVRVMAEGEDERLITAVVDEICAALAAVDRAETTQSPGALGEAAE